MKNLLVLALLLPLAAAGQGFRTMLKGTVTGRDSKALMLRETIGDISTRLDSIPIVNGKFEHTFEGNHVVQYDLCFIEEFLSGTFMITCFFPDAEVVELSFNGREYEINGGALNRRLDELYSERQHWMSHATDEYMTLRKKIRELPRPDVGHVWDNPEYKLLRARADEIRDSMERVSTDWNYGLLERYDDLAAYSMFIEELESNWFPENLAVLDRLVAKFTAAHPGHPYNGKATALVNAHKMKTTGGRFVDFTAPDIYGNTHTLSKEIAGKVALISLLNTLDAVPYFRDKGIYDKYKDKGFTMVFVLRARSDAEDIKDKLAHLKYPWLTLVEFDDKAGIWDKYGGHATLLIDREGLVVKVINSYGEADGIREYLEQNLN